MNIEEKREHEKLICHKMIEIWCHGNHDCRDGLCPSCQQLDAYVRQRVDVCPFMETKTFCSSCKVHCYKPEMRTKIKEAMRYSGPRMMLYHPVLTVKHGIETCRQKREMKQES